MQNLKRALGRDNGRLLLLTLNDWAVARAGTSLPSFAKFGASVSSCELFVTFGQR